MFARSHPALKKLLSCTLLIMLYGCGQDSIPPLVGCNSNQEFVVYCGFQNPEDLALTPDNNFLIVAEFGGMAPLVEMQPGKLSFFDLTTKIRRDALITFGSNVWGDPACTRDPAIPFGPHGVDLIEREDGKFQLAVVSHYPNESIEMFELKNPDEWVLEWKGCINVDGNYYFNDVSLDKAGNFYATHMFDADYSLARVVWNVFAKSDTGFVVKWSTTGTFEELEFTAGSFPNGIALDIDKGNLLVNYNLGDKTVLYDLSKESILGEYKHNSPDNVVIQNGYAWVTNHDHAATDTFKCDSNPNCPLPFSVNQLSLEDLSLISAFKFKNSNMGVGTVGLPYQNSIWIGSYHSDRLAEAKIALSE